MYPFQPDLDWGSFNIDADTGVVTTTKPNLQCQVSATYLSLSLSLLSLFVALCHSLPFSLSINLSWIGSLTGIVDGAMIRKALSLRTKAIQINTMHS